MRSPLALTIFARFASGKMTQFNLTILIMKAGRTRYL
jgi:hypothetical protein